MMRSPNTMAREERGLWPSFYKKKMSLSPENFSKSLNHAPSKICFDSYFGSSKWIEKRGGSSSFREGKSWQIGMRIKKISSRRHDTTFNFHDKY